MVDLEPLKREYAPCLRSLTNSSVLFFEGDGELFPLGEHFGPLFAKLIEFSGILLGLLGGDEVAETLLDGGDAGFEAWNLFLGGAKAVFELFELDGIEAFDRNRWGCGRSRWLIRNPDRSIDT